MCMKNLMAMRSVGYLGIFIGALLIGIQGGLIRYLIPKLGLRKMIIIGLIFYGAGLFTYRICC